MCPFCFILFQLLGVHLIIFETQGTIADYTPMTSPMVPSIIVHCIREIESRGLTEIGIYRIPGAEREVKALKVLLPNL